MADKVANSGGKRVAEEEATAAAGPMSKYLKNESLIPAGKKTVKAMIAQKLKKCVAWALCNKKKKINPINCSDA